jgi:amino acid transporter
MVLILLLTLNFIHNSIHNKMQPVKFLIVISLLSFFTPSPAFSTVLPDTTFAPQSKLITADSVRKRARTNFKVSGVFTAMSATYLGMAAISKGTALVLGLLYGAAALSLFLAIAGIVYSIQELRYAKKIKAPCRECPPKKSKRSKLADIMTAIGFIFLGVVSVVGVFTLNGMVYPFLMGIFIVLAVFMAFIGLGLGISLLVNLKRYNTK